MNPDNILFDYETRLEKEKQQKRLGLLQEEELQNQVWRNMGEKTEKEIEEVKARRKKNREDQEKLIGKLITFGDGYVIQPPVREPEIEWKDQEDRFGIRSIRFEDNGKSFSSEENLGDNINNLKDYRFITKLIDEAADKRIQELTRSDMEMDEYYCRDDVL